VRAIVIDSDERCVYEVEKRQQAMERARQKLQKLQERVGSGNLKQPEKIGAAVERIMQKYHGYRYFDWKLKDGKLDFFESATHFEREKGIEGKYVIATTEKNLSVRDAVAMYKDLTDVESGFRRLKDVLAVFSARSGSQGEHVIKDVGCRACTDGRVLHGIVLDTASLF
jgi:transposase